MRRLKDIDVVSQTPEVGEGGLLGASCLLARTRDSDSSTR